MEGNGALTQHDWCPCKQKDLGPGEGLRTTEARTGVRKQTKRCQGLWQPQKLTEGQGTESVLGGSLVTPC